MPDVLEGAVVGYPRRGDGRAHLRGRRATKPGARVDARPVREHFARAGLAVFKHPERVQIVEQLPRNSVGKVVRGELAQLARVRVGHDS